MQVKEQQDKLDEWKSKFFELSASVETQKKYEELLERSLSRLALAAQGIEPALDKHLTTLRKQLRNKRKNISVLETLLKKIEFTLGQIDDKPKAITIAYDNITQLLSDVNWPEKYQKTIKKIHKKVHTKSEKQLPVIVGHLITLLNQCMSDASSSKSGFFSKLFSSKSDTSNSTSRTTEKQATITDENQAHISPPQLLTELLEKISFPKELSNHATQIQSKIQHGIDIADIPAAIEDIAELVTDLGSLASKEKKEYEAFLKELTTKITTLDQHLSTLSQDDLTAYEQRQLINDNVEQEMQSLRSDVVEAVELDKLKQSLNIRMETLNQHIEHYQQADSERIQQSQQQINELNQRLKQMEIEAAELREATQKAREIAMKDALTGAWNRQALTEALEQAFSRWQRYSEPLTMVIWDIDHFKNVNDLYGHSAGDVVLKTIATLFNKSTRKSDFIARFGGEEFVGLLPGINLEEGLVMANKVCQIIEKTHFHSKNISVPITTSAGLAAFEQGDSIDDVFGRADKALYAAKNSGRNNCKVEYKND